MKETGIFFGSSSGYTESVAVRILERYGKDSAELRDVADSSPADLLSYPNLILGISTWGIGELQDDWADFLPGMEKLDFSGRKAALFGLGDQESYPDTFADALGILYRSVRSRGCGILGRTPTRGYEFIRSAAVVDGEFVGLVLDEKNQSHMTDQRIDAWLAGLRSGFKGT